MNTQVTRSAKLLSTQVPLQILRTSVMIIKSKSFVDAGAHHASCRHCPNPNFAEFKRAEKFIHVDAPAHRPALRCPIPLHF